MMLALGFTFSAWLLQQQTVLPALQGSWAYILKLGLSSLVVKIKFDVIAFKLSLNPHFKSSVQETITFVVDALFGFYWASYCNFTCLGHGFTIGGSV